MQNIGIVSNIIILCLLLFFIICFFVIFVINLIQKRNYLKAQTLVAQTKKELLKKYHIINFKVVDTFDKKIPMVVIRNKKNITEVKIPEDQKRIIQIDQAIQKINSSNGTLTHEELEEIEQKLN